MTRLLLISVLILAGCREEAVRPDPVALTAESVGYFCQMNILDHGGPKAQVHLDTFPGQPLFFSQVRDAVAYLRMPEKDGQILATYVTDMGSTSDWNDPTKAAWVLAEQAIYVVGSDQLGGMDQPEFIPFADAQQARAFVQDHGGQAMALTDIPDAALSIPGEAAADSGDAADFANRLNATSSAQGN